MLHFAQFLSTPFEVFEMNPFFTCCLIFVQTSFFSCFEHFFEKVSESNTMFYFGSFLSGQTQNETQQPKKLKPLNHINPKHPKHQNHKPSTPKHLNTLNTLNILNHKPPNTLNTLNNLNT